MTFWQGLLACLFLMPVSEQARPKRKPDANRLVADAVAAEVTWRTFPGFVADLEVEYQGMSGHGRLIVEWDGRVFVESLPDNQRDWAARYLGWIVRQRLPGDEVRQQTWMFASLWEERQRGGYAVCRSDSPFGPCHWIQNQQFQAIDVRSARCRERLTTLETERNLDNKILPVVLVLHQWNARTLELESTEARLLSWQRVGQFDLPASIRVLAAGAFEKPASGRIVLTRQRLFSAPPTQVASR